MNIYAGLQTHTKCDSDSVTKEFYTCSREPFLGSGSKKYIKYWVFVVDSAKELLDS